MIKAKMPYMRSARARVTAWYALLLAVTLLAFGIFVNLQMRNILLAQEDAALQVAGDKLLPAIATTTLPPVFLKTGSNAQRFQDATSYVNQQLFSVHLTTANGTIIDSIGALDKSVSFGRPSTIGSTTWSVSPGGRLRMYTVRLETSNGQIAGWLQIVHELDGLNKALQTLLIQTLFGVPLVLLLATLGGIFLANRVFRPIDRITRTAQAISAHDLSRRIVYHGPPDEIGRLAITFDHMLDRLEETFERERRFTADASHELRTPLTALKGSIEVTLSRARTREEYIQAFTDIGQDVTRLIHLSSALLELARLDQKQQGWQMEILDVSDLLATMMDSMQPQARAHEITLSSALSPELFVRGDLDQLTRLFLNLLDNAIKYTPAGGCVTVQSERNNTDICISFHDTGPGIAPEHMPHLFERFYRVEEGRTRSTGGTGLGLAIAYEIAQKHGGTLEIQSNVQQGTTALVLLPYHTIR